MRLIKFGGLLILFSTFTSCGKRLKLDGEWHVTALKMYRKGVEDTLRLNLDDMSGFRVLRDYSSSSWSAMSDSQYYAFHRKCFLKLEKDSSFTLRDLGFILPTNFSLLRERVLRGRWSYRQAEQTLALISANESFEFDLTKRPEGKMVLRSNADEVIKEIQLVEVSR
jgi:hypothetical protein